MQTVSALASDSPSLGSGVYPERLERRENILDDWTRITTGGLWHRLRPFQGRLQALAASVDALSAEMSALDDAQIRREMRMAAVPAMRQASQAARAFALAREGAARALGLTPFDTQIMGAMVLMAGKLCEMATGEGKTLTAALAASVAAMAGEPVHVVTVNDYLAQRDAEEMGPLYAYFGLTVGVIVTGMSPEARQQAYRCDVTYCTNKELVFDYLKDRVAAGGRASQAQLKVRAMHAGEQGVNLLLRGLHFAIVDEADSILIDEARTPLILSRKSAASGDSTLYEQALVMAEAMEAGLHFELTQSRRELRLTELGKSELGSIGRELGGAWLSAQGREHLVAQALRALHLFHRDQHYLVDDGKVHIIDEYTGRILPGRTWEQGLHQLIEVKEGCPLSDQATTLARITYQRFFRRYLRVSGMTGTAKEVSREIWRVYGLETVAVPTHRPSRRQHQSPVLCRDGAEKWKYVADMVQAMQREARPVLIGTRSVEASEQLSAALQARGIEHRVLNARQDADEAEIIAEAGQPGVVTVATNMAGRGTDIRLGPGVSDRGGLHVILTEYHDSPRIDRQLVGRCARQGDPGSVVAVVALDDALFRDHGGWLYRLVVSQPSWAMSPLGLGWLRHRAQKSAERIHARVRRDTLRQDRNLDTLLAFAGNPI